MTHPNRGLGGLASLILILIVSGCTMSSGQRYETASRAYETATAVLTAASLSGEISLEDLRKFNTIRDQAAALLDEWGSALDRGEDFDGYREFQMVLDRLILLKLELEAQDAGGDAGGASGHETQSGYLGGDPVGYRTAA